MSRLLKVQIRKKVVIHFFRDGLLSINLIYLADFSRFRIVKIVSEIAYFLIS